VSVEAAFREHRRVLEASMEGLVGAVERAAERVAERLAGGGKLLVCGNGGSAADAQHFAAELVGRFEGERRALPALALTTDTSILTAVANDYSYHLVFARQVAAFATPGDLLVAISTSGRSANVLAAAAEARRIGCPVIALTGEGGGDLAGAAEVVLAVPSRRTSRIQEIHALCLHALLERVEARLAADAEPER